MNAGLGGECALADIGSMAVGSAIEEVVERMRDAGDVAERTVGNADVEFFANSGFSFSVGMMETRLALPQRSPMPFSVP